MRLPDKKGAGVVLTVLMLAGTSVTADTEIFRCALEDGTFGFQELPCPEADPQGDGSDDLVEDQIGNDTPVTDDAFNFINPFDEPVNPPTPVEPAPPNPVSQDRAECEKMTRDAIDVIDFEMRGKSYTKNEGEQYLAELLVLTRQLRACKQL